jgi:hypothetical protein
MLTNCSDLEGGHLSGKFKSLHPLELDEYVTLLETKLIEPFSEPDHPVLVGFKEMKLKKEGFFKISKRREFNPEKSKVILEIEGKESNQTEIQTYPLVIESEETRKNTEMGSVLTVNFFPYHGMGNYFDARGDLKKIVSNSLEYCALKRFDHLRR